MGTRHVGLIAPHMVFQILSLIASNCSLYFQFLSLSGLLGVKSFSKSVSRFYSLHSSKLSLYLLQSLNTMAWVYRCLLEGWILRGEGMGISWFHQLKNHNLVVRFWGIYSYYYKTCQNLFLNRMTIYWLVLGKIFMKYIWVFLLVAEINLVLLGKST